MSALAARSWTKEALDALPVAGGQEALEARDRLRVFLGVLDPRLRQVLHARLEGSAPGEIARRCFPGRRASAARHALTRELTRLRRSWERWCEEEDR